MFFNGAKDSRILNSRTAKQKYEARATWVAPIKGSECRRRHLRRADSPYDSPFDSLWKNVQNSPFDSLEHIMINGGGAPGTVSADQAEP